MKRPFSTEQFLNIFLLYNRKVAPMQIVLAALALSALRGIGFLAVFDKKLPVYLYIRPVLWLLVGFSAAYSLKIREDYGLFAAAMAGLILIVGKQLKKEDMEPI